MKDLSVMEQKKGSFLWKRLILALLIVFMSIGILERPEQVAASYKNIDNFTSFEGIPLGMSTGGVAIDSSGKIYISDRSNMRIVIYNPDGTEYTKITLNYHPGAIAIKDNILYMEDGGAIHRFNINRNYELISEIYVGHLAGGAIHGLAVDSEGTVYTAGYAEIVKINSSGDSSVDFDFKAITQTFNGLDVAIDDDDNLYVLAGHRHIHKFDKNRNLLNSWSYGENMTSLAYHDGALYLAVSTNSHLGFRIISATDSRIIGEHIQQELFNAVFYITVHPVTNDIYLSYRNNGVLVYKDAGTTIVATASSYEIQYGEEITFDISVTANDGIGKPDGTIALMDGEVKLADVNLVDGKASYKTTALPGGSRIIKAVYEGSGDYAGSTSATMVIEVAKLTNSITVETSKANTIWGETVTYTAIVNGTGPDGEPPTGLVTFSSESTVLGRSSLEGGRAVLSSSGLSPGTHNITAQYDGDAAFEMSEATVQQTVEKAPSSISLSADGEIVPYGRSVMVFAYVTVSPPGFGEPTGQIVFKNGETVLATQTLSPTMSGEGYAMLDITNLEVGTHSITAEYIGDDFVIGSNNTITLTVEKANTIVGLSSSNIVSLVGEHVTLQANVIALWPSTGVPTGSVIFKKAETVLGTATLTDGNALLELSDLEVGTHTITAQFAGDRSFIGSEGTLQQKVNKADALVTVSSMQNTSDYGESVDITATVTVENAGHVALSGDITFKNGEAVLDTVTLSEEGVAKLTINSLEVGTHTIVAEFSGNSFVRAGSGTIVHTINSLHTTTVLTASQEPSVYGETLAFTAIVSSASSTPEGTVTFFNDATIIGVEELVDGVAVLSGVDNLDVGTHNITAEYNGSAWFNGSTDTIQQTVQQASTSISLVTSKSVSVFGEKVELTATVAVEAPGTGAPSGTLIFKNNDNDEVLGTVTLGGSTATLDISELEVDTHTISVQYTGDSTFIGSKSTVQQTVNKANTIVTVTSSKNTNVYGEMVTFTATVAAESPGAGTPNGNLTFLNEGKTIGTGNLSNGEFSITIDELPVGTYSITAEYSGNSSFTIGRGTVTQKVIKADTNLDVTVSKATVAYGEQVSLTAMVSAAVFGREAPTGDVTMFFGTEPIGSGSLESSILTLYTDQLPVGTHRIDVFYSGDELYEQASQSVEVTVNKADTLTEVTISKSSVVFGEKLTIITQVRAVTPGKGTPTGVVTVSNGTEIVATGVLVDGESVIEIGELPVNNYNLEIAYSGDNFFNASASIPLMLTVEKAQTTSSVRANRASIVTGSPITLTAEIVAVTAESGIPTGKVIFFNNHGEIGQVVMDTKSNGVAELNIQQGWGSGSYVITAEYEGDNRFHGSQSASFDLVVNAPASPPQQLPEDTEDVEPIVSSNGIIAIPAGGTGTVSLGEVVSVSIPLGLSDKEVRMTIEEIAAANELILSQQALVSSVYEILANLEGTFSKEITISFVFDASMLGLNQTAAIFYFDEEKREWVEIGGTIEGDNISVSVDHLTKFAVFAIQSDMFIDTKGHWAEEAIRLAAASGVVTGYPDGSFLPNNPITRAEFLFMLTGALPLQETSKSIIEFSDDVKIGAWARSAVYAAQQAGIITGYNDNTFRPKASITRVEMAKMITKALGLEEKAITETGFADDSLVPQWAKGAVEAVRRAGIIGGRSDNKFSPYENATRAEAATILMRLLGQ